MPKVPPPLPPPFPQTQIEIAYSSATASELPRWSAARVIPAVVWGLVMAAVLHTGLAVIAPRFEGIFSDYRLDLPPFTKLLIVISRAYRDYYLWLLTTPMLIGIPFLWLTFAPPRRRERAVRLIACLLIGCFVTWMLLSLLLPLSELYGQLGTASGKK